VLSDDEEHKNREDRDRLRAIDSKLDSLYRQRQELIAEMRRLSAEQKALYDRRQAPQAEVEQLYEHHAGLGKQLTDLRRAREAARAAADQAVVALRELRLTIAPSERVRPDQIRKEIRDLELRQQTHALPLDEENALIARLRQRTHDLKEAEAHAQVALEHERQRKEAEARVAAARAEVERLGAEFTRARAERDAAMASVRAKLEAAGGLVAELRAKGRARADVMDKIDAVSREMHELEREGRDLLAATRARQEEARKMVRAYAPRRGRTPEEALASVAEAQLNELLKRGKVTLGG
jgi:chromosome segregation protein